MASLSSGLNQSHYVNAVAEVVSALIVAYDAQVSINLSKIKGEVAKKHKFVTVCTSFRINYCSGWLTYRN